MSVNKKAKAAQARKNAEAEKAKKKAVRTAKAGIGQSSGPVKKGQKPASLIKNSKKKK
ncbi:MAG: hypothetical protein AAFO94_18020 [Bacteroidota bacterium]